MVIKLFPCSTQLSMKFQQLIKLIMLKNRLLTFNLSDDVFIMLINVKMSTIVSILTFMSMINFMLSSVEQEKSFTTLGPGIYWIQDLQLHVIIKQVREHCGSVVEWLTGDRGAVGSSHTGVTVVSLSKTHFSLLSTGSTQEDPSRHN